MPVQVLINGVFCYVCIITMTDSSVHLEVDAERYHLNICRT